MNFNIPLYLQVPLVRLLPGHHPVLRQQPGQENLQSQHGIPRPRASSGSLSKPLEGKLIFEILRVKVVRIEGVWVGIVLLADCELRKINVNDVPLRNDEVCVWNPVVLSAHSLVGCEQGFVSLNNKCQQT